MPSCTGHGSFRKRLPAAIRKCSDINQNIPPRRKAEVVPEILRVLKITFLNPGLRQRTIEISLPR